MLRLLGGLFVLFSAGCLCASPDTTLRLMPEVQVLAIRSDVALPKTRLADSLLKTFAPGAPLAEVLFAGHAIGMRSNGPGLLTTTSIRGLSAQHTGVVWNGVPLQNPMLGQTAFELIPAWFIGQMALQTGNQNAAFGGNCAGGVVQLSSSAPIQTGFSANALSQFSDLGLWTFGAGASYARKGQQIGLKTLRQQGALNYRYLEPYTHQTERRSHHRLEQTGVQLDVSQRLGHNLHLHFASQWLQTHRQLPGSIWATQSRETQGDQSWRSSLNLQYTGQRTGISLRQGFVNEKLHYQNQHATINSQSAFNQWFTELDAKALLLSWLQIGIVANHLYHQVDAPVYNMQEGRTSVSGYLKAQSQKLRAQVSIRQESIHGPGNWPLSPVPAAELGYQLSDALQFHAKAAGILRIPTLNDRFWTPGGNPALLPEQGFSAEVGLRTTQNTGNVKLMNEGSIFVNELQNRLIWLPAGSYWQAQNLGLVQAKGFESRHELLFKAHGKQQVGLQFAQTYTHAQHVQEGQTARQLIFQPRYVATAQAWYQLNHWRLMMSNRYSGKVYTQTDLSGHLQPFTQTELLAGYQLQINNYQIQTNAKIGNLFNQQAFMADGFPMPSRFYQISILVQFHENTQHTSH